jgi:hypothetical protein
MKLLYIPKGEYILFYKYASFIPTENIEETIFGLFLDTLDYSISPDAIIDKLLPGLYREVWNSSEINFPILKNELELIY